MRAETFVSMARTVLRFTPEAVANVMSGASSLDKAYEAAKYLRIKKTARLR